MQTSNERTPSEDGRETYMARLFTRSELAAALRQAGITPIAAETVADAIYGPHGKPINTSREPWGGIGTDHPTGAHYRINTAYAESCVTTALMSRFPNMTYTTAAQAFDQWLTDTETQQ